MLESSPESNIPADTRDQPSNAEGIAAPIRRHLDATRKSITHHFNITCSDQTENQEIDGYIIVGLFDDGSPGELFIKIAKQGSTISGLMNTVGILTSMALQYGVPIGEIAGKLEYMRFEPAGRTSNEDIRYAQSIVDYIFRWMGNEFSQSYRDERKHRDTQH